VPDVSRAPQPADKLASAVRAAAQRGDGAALGRLARDVLAHARAAPPGDEGAVELTHMMLTALVQRAEFRPALAFAQQAAATLGYDPLASAEMLPRLATGDEAGARRLAEQLADAPVEFGGHGLRAIVRTLLGRDDDAAADGAAFIDEAHAVLGSLAAWRQAARRYSPSTAHMLGRYGHLHGELERAFPGSRPWRGEPLDGRTVVLQLLEGLGDQVEGLRLARTVRAAGGRVLVGCDERLHDLVRQAGLADGFVDRPLPARHAYGPVDFHLVVGAWLHESGLPPSLWPAEPYLTVDDAGDADVLPTHDGPRVGVVWAGNPDFALERTRGMPYGALKRLVAATPHVQWVSLMRPDHPRVRELAATPVTRRVVDAGALGTLVDAARLVRRLDLLVTTDTALAHLAGALGVPVWTVLGPTFNWRWRLDGDSTPLYPSMRLVREATAGDWNAAADRVARDLSGTS
jgi:hypothetical protein